VEALQDTNSNSLTNTEPFGVLVNKALKERLRKVRAKELEVEERVHEINGRISDIEARN
jgi:hypothetical protein